MTGSAHHAQLVINQGENNLPGKVQNHEAYQVPYVPTSDLVT